MSSTDALTPVHLVDTPQGDVWVKRDDLFEFGGVHGGKVRTCLALARRAMQQGKVGLVTAGALDSPQVQIVARVASKLGLKARCWITKGNRITQEVQVAIDAGAEILRASGTYPAHADYAARTDPMLDAGFALVPFGMRDPVGLSLTAIQTENIPDGVNRIVIVAGSGMSASGVLTGLRMRGRRIPMLAIQVGRDPAKVLDDDALGALNWRFTVTVVRSPMDYKERAPSRWCGLVVDPVYEAKVVPFLRAGDLFWIVGVRHGL